MYLLIKFCCDILFEDLTCRFHWPISHHYSLHPLKTAENQRVEKQVIGKEIGDMKWVNLLMTIIPIMWKPVDRNIGQ